MTTMTASCPKCAPSCPNRGRRALARPAHLCRARGDRRCRCHIGARTRLARLTLSLRPLLVADVPHPGRSRLQSLFERQAPQQAPLRPQAPPFTSSAALSSSFRTGNGYERHF
ncbi:hypothetical protein JCM7686_2671 [Paracoccus aminophilus JCM 7686]|uniref:Uncharacterized protein n=1 Tax=Paracoccus aminophilus JCM 7686 TaxID=1367847 RepID=S5XWQ1_PARAH|nr:hypothetical protein JCM7686_2671 [Paracoccus aminophilus JCM 7686]